MYILRRNANKFNVPRRAIAMEKIIVIGDEWEEVNQDQLKRTFTRIETESMQMVLEGLRYYRIPFEKMLVFNRGDSYIPFDKK